MSIPQMVKDRAMVTIDARLEPHFSVTSFFFLQTSRSSRKLSEFSTKSINFAKKRLKGPSINYVVSVGGGGG